MENDTIENNLEHENHFHKRLEDLSNTYGDIQERADSTLISNDEGIIELMPTLHEAVGNHSEDGIAIFVGSGGIESILPELDINTSVMLDINKSALELSKLISQCIVEGSSPEEVLRRIQSDEMITTHKILADIIESWGDKEAVGKFIAKEKVQYGNYHWTNSERFGLAQKALKEKPIIRIAADITNADFAQNFTAICEENGKEIVFANLTNVHAWLDKNKRDFLTRLPVADNASLIHSSFAGAKVGDWPKVRTAKTKEEYTEFALSDET
jgi:hypothetical protein